MRLDRLGQPRCHPSLDRADIELQQNSFCGSMLAARSQKCPGDVEGWRDRDLERVHELERDGEGEHGGWRDRSAHSLSLTLHSVDVVLRDDSVQPSAIDSKRGCGDDCAVGSQIITARKETLFQSPVGSISPHRGLVASITGRAESTNRACKALVNLL
jgi:hypothetical protein